MVELREDENRALDSQDSEGWREGVVSDPPDPIIPTNLPLVRVVLRRPLPPSTSLLSRDLKLNSGWGA